jgi:hypothetical protein
MARQAVFLDIGSRIPALPMRQRIDLEPACPLLDLEELEPGARRALLR